MLSNKRITTIIVIAIVLFIGIISCKSTPPLVVIGEYESSQYFSGTLLGSSAQTEIILKNQGSYMCFGHYNLPFSKGTKIVLTVFNGHYEPCRIEKYVEFSN